MVASGAWSIVGEGYEEDGTERITVAAQAKSGLRGLGANQITISADFFVSALRDYDDWQIKWWREVVQNAIDAGARTVKLEARADSSGDENVMIVSCEDDGSGMDRKTVINKFLVLGGSGKAGKDTAGGFGKAKELILLPWLEWRIETRDIEIVGHGIDYEVGQLSRARQGTKVSVVQSVDRCTYAHHAQAFLEKCDLPGVRFTVNGKTVRADLKAERPMRSIPGKAQIYLTPTREKQSYLYVRTKGLFMFSQWIGETPGYILAEITAPSIEILTANRDGFRDREVRYAIDNLAREISKDAKSAFREASGMIRKKFRGTGKFTPRLERRTADMLASVGPTSSGPLTAQTIKEVTRTLSDHAKDREHEMDAAPLHQPPSVASAEAMLSVTFTGQNHIEAAIKQLAWEPDFYLINEIEGYKVPARFFPETMAPTVLKLAKTWTEMCRFVLMQLGSSVKYGVGFMFSDDAGAAALHDEDGEDWLLLNPFKDMRKRTEIWHPTKEPDLKWLYAAAIHEATHLADGIHYHDESFSSAMTFNMAKCANGFKKIRQIAAGIKMKGGQRAG